MQRKAGSMVRMLLVKKMKAEMKMTIITSKKMIEEQPIVNYRAIVAIDSNSVVVVVVVGSHRSFEEAESIPSNLSSNPMVSEKTASARTVAGASEEVVVVVEEED